MRLDFVDFIVDIITDGKIMFASTKLKMCFVMIILLFKKPIFYDELLPLNIVFNATHALEI